MNDIQIAKEYLAGKSLRQIQADHNTTLGMVRKALANQNVQTRTSGRIKIELDWYQIGLDYQLGQSIAELAHEYKVSPGTITAGILQQGVKIRPQVKRRTMI